MTTTVAKSVAEYSAEILKLKNGFATTLQTTGGFSLPANITEKELEYLKVENIYRRLGVLATDNLVAVSECVKNESDPKSVVTVVLQDSTIFGCENDTGFIMHPTTTTQEDSKFTVDEQPIVQKNMNPAENGTTRVLTIKMPESHESHEIKIASIHLPGDGPKSKPISEFLTDNLGHLRATEVQVICGDTNITDNKVMPNQKPTRLDEIANYFYGFFGNAPCLILSSNVPVIKHRRGFILRNQQLRKSVPESETSAESDGTIIAIKLGPIITANAIRSAIESIDLNCVAKLGRDSPETIKTQSPSPSVAALNFKTAIEGCIDRDDGHPMEPIWLDHSLLHIKMQTLGTLLGITIPPKFPRNLIVANMGSIVNAGGKNWNTTYIPKQLEINNTDKVIYDIIKGTATPETPLPEYADITGSAMIKSDSVPKPLGVDEITINVSDDITTKITAELTKLKDMLDSSVTQGTRDGGSRKRLRFTRRRTHKYKSKSKSKFKAKAKSRKIRKMSRSIKPKSRKS